MTPASDTAPYPRSPCESAPGRRIVARSASSSGVALEDSDAALGLVRRAEAEHDRRIKTAEVTPEGHRVVEAINQGRRRLLEEAFAGWSEEDRVALARLTRRFSDAMFALIDSMGEPSDRSG